MPRFLVTGATGCVGRTVAHALAARGSVTPLARRVTPSFDAGTTAGITAGVTHDLTQPLPDLPALDGAVVVHCAAEIRANAWADHWRGNVIATRHVMDWAVRHRSPRVVVFSTGGVYGFQSGRRMSERDPVTPEGHYARTKLMAEDIARAIAGRHGVDLVILRLYFPFGGSFPRGGAAAAGLFQRVLAAVRDGGVLHVNAGGAPRITPVHVDDVAAAVLASVEPSFAPGTFNLCGDEDLSVLDLIERVQVRVGGAAILRHTQQASGDLMGDNTSLRLTGWTPIRSVNGYLDGLETFRMSDRMSESPPANASANASTAASVRIANARIFITGGAGFIGTRLAQLLAGENEIVLFDNLHRNAYQSSDLARTDGGRGGATVRLVQGDVRDAAALRAALDPDIDYVIHAAAIAGVETMIGDPLLVLDVNVRGTFNVAERPSA